MPLKNVKIWYFCPLVSGKPCVLNTIFPLDSFGYFWLTIQNKANQNVSNAFDLLSVFISFPLARCCCCCCGSCGFLLLRLRAPTPPRPPFLGEGSTKKEKSPVASGMAFGHFGIGVGVVKVAVRLARSECKRLASSLGGYPTDRHCASSLS
jgi:hypothetical protein